MVPPTVSFTSPTNNASVMPSFAITDNQAIASVDVTLDGNSLGPVTNAPFQWTAPPGADNGGGGSGGCNTAGNHGAPLFLLGLGAMFLIRRRRA